MTMTTDQPAAPAGDAAGGRATEPGVPGGERMVWFAGGFMVALHLVVLVGLAVLGFGTDTLELRRAVDEPVAGAERVYIATEFAFDPSTATEPSGLLTITLVNEGAIFHNLLIEGIGGFVVEADAGATASGQVELEEGVFTLFCSVPGHREAGMVATLTIDAG